MFISNYLMIRKVSNNRNITLNPEATVFNLPTKSSENATSNQSGEEVHPFMNGDVGNQPSGDHNPPSEEQQHVPAQNYVVESTSEKSSAMEQVVEPSVETMSDTVSTMAAALDRDSESLATQNEDPNSIKSDSEYQTPSSQEYIGNEDTGQETDNVPANDDNEETGAEVSSKSLSRNEIKEIIGQQVEFFFSRENWSSDRYLLSQMDGDQYVPVYILANCSQFKAVTKDHSIILEALKESSFVQLDEDNNRVRPNYQRCIVILREIAQSTPIEDIEAMFTGEGCPKAISCEFIHNDVWYVTFESDNDAQKAYRYLRETVKTFNDKPILARIKTKPASKSNCFSVLPSYGGKPPGEQRETIPNPSALGSTPAPVGPMGPNSNIPGVTNPPPPPSHFSSNARVFYPQNNPSNYSYNYSNPQAPPAYFYPNPMISWSQPNFYDFSQFVQYNGLSPRAAFKPAASARYNNNGSNGVNSNNRRNKNNNRDTKIEPRNNNSSGSTNRQSSRPPSVTSLTNPIIGPTNVNSAHSHANSLPNCASVGDTKGSNSGCSTPNSSLMGLPAANFSQTDLSIASPAYPLPITAASISGRPDCHSPLVPCSNNNPGVSSETVEEPAATNGSSLNGAVPVATVNNVPPPSSQVPVSFPHSSSQTTNAHHGHPTVTHRSTFNNEAHSANPGRDTQPQRQNMPRGNRRKPSRRDDEPNSHGSGNGVSGRGSSSRGAAQSQENQSKVYSDAKKPHFELQATSFPPLPCADEIVVDVPEEKIPEPVSQTAWAKETHKFSDVMKGTAKQKATGVYEKEGPELMVQATMTSEPISASTTAKTSPSVTSSSKTPHSPSSNSRTTHQTSGNVKSAPSATTSAKVVQSTSSSAKVVPSTSNSRAITSNSSARASTSVSSKTTSNSSSRAAQVNIGSSGKSTISDVVKNSLTSNNSVVKSTVVTTSCPAKSSASSSNNSNNVSQNSGVKIVQPSSSTSTSQKENGSNAVTSSDDVASQITYSNASKSAQETNSARHEKTSSNREQRPGRDDRRPITNRREFSGGIGRGNLRRDGNTRLSGNKENRPQQKSWRETRPDDEGWITKGAKETRNNRDHRSDAHSFHDKNISKATHPMVNGDSSPPPTSKTEVESKPVTNLHTTNKVATNNSKNVVVINTEKTGDETLRENEKTINNNEGEHKPSWAKMAMASKDKMERLSAEIKEKEEQERMKKTRTTRPVAKVTNEKSIAGRERDSKPYKSAFPTKDLSERPAREFRGPPENRNSINYRQRDTMRSKSPASK